LTEETIKDKVFKLLDTNSLLYPKQICNLLHLNYNDYGNYVTVLRSEWKTLFEKRRGLKRLSFHGWHGWVYVPRSVDLRQAVDGGWVRTRARNRYLLWKSKLGRLEWFPSTGRVKIWVRKPASLGKCYQLLADAFFKTALIFDIRVFEPFLKSVQFKGASAVFDVGERLPYAKIDFLKLSNGVVITLGDRSHPTSVEIDFCLPDWAERMEALVSNFMKVLKTKQPKPVKDVDYRV
jgi:hypothetical protein